MFCRKRFIFKIVSITFVLFFLMTGSGCANEREGSTHMHGASSIRHSSGMESGHMNSDETELSGSVKSGMRVVEVHAYRYGYDPDPIVIKKGEKVRLELKSRDVTHGFGIAALSIDERIPAGQTTTLEFTPEKPGEYHIHCTVYCGPGHEKMHGTLRIVE